MRKDVSPTFAKLFNMWKLAKRQLDAADILLRENPLSGVEAVPFIVRGWHVLSCLEAIEKNESVSSLENFVERLDRRSLSFLSETDLSLWRESLVHFCSYTKAEPWYEPKIVPPLYINISKQLGWLSKALNLSLCHIKKLHGESFWSKKKNRRMVVGIASLLVVSSLVYILFLSFRPPLVWRIEFYPNVVLKGVSVVRFADKVDYNWNIDSPAIGIPKDSFSARLGTCMKLEQETSVNFELGSDDGSRLLVDGQLMINNWGDHGVKFINKKIKLAPGIHHLQVEYYERGGGAALRLHSKYLTPERLFRPTFGEDKVLRCEEKRT